MDFLSDSLLHASFWVAAAQIVGVNIILFGDNAVVIALACMHLPPRQRLWGIHHFHAGPLTVNLAAVFGAAFVVLFGRWMAHARREARSEV